MSVSDRASQGLAEVNKRLTLNWLIQGASVHASRTMHHLVRNELAARNPALPGVYDRFGVAMQLQYWRGEIALRKHIGRLWRAVFRRPTPFASHRLLNRYAGLLSKAAKARTLARAKEKRVVRLPGAFSFYIIGLLVKVGFKERGHQRQLDALCRKAAAQVFGIDENRLHGQIVKRDQLQNRNFLPPTSLSGVLFQAGIVSWNQVVFANGAAHVYARALNGFLLMAELVKGTAELICLHGLTELDDRTYADVIHAADKIEHEPIMIETGGELWRRLLHVLPSGVSTAHVLMELARLAPDELETLVESVILETPAAGENLARLISLSSDDAA